MATRPLVSVSGPDGGQNGQVPLPAVFATPLRTDIVQTVHTNMAKNARQPYAVSRNAGMQSSAESWGTGRAVSRIPRVPGGGTHRAGQGAFGNMCRGGRMFAPLKIWRRWHRPINLKQKRFAVSAAIAASGVPALLMARGHRVSQLNEVPLVITDSLEDTHKTKKALEILKNVGALEDVDKAKNSKQIRSGKGKWRNRRYTIRKGPLIVYSKDSGIVKAFRNIPGIELCPVDSLNLLKLAPGGHIGRFIIWTQSAFEKLDPLFGDFDKFSEQKKGWKLPDPQMKNFDLARIINSDEIQSAINPPKQPDQYQSKVLKKNAMKNLGALLKLNPQAKQAKRQQLLFEAKRRENKGQIVKVKRDNKIKPIGHKFYKTLVKDSDYQGEDYDHFSSWLGVTQ